MSVVRALRPEPKNASRSTNQINLASILDHMHRTIASPGTEMASHGREKASSGTGQKNRRGTEMVSPITEGTSPGTLRAKGELGHGKDEPR